jgi:hypothetical protein
MQATSSDNLETEFFLSQRATGVAAIRRETNS